MSLVVEHSVVRQLVLGARCDDAPALEQEGCVVQLPLAPPRPADDQPGPAIRRLGSERGDARVAGIEEGRLEDQILRRVAGDRELRRDDEIRPLRRRLGARCADARAFFSTSPSCGLICASAIFSVSGMGGS